MTNFNQKVFFLVKHAALSLEDNFLEQTRDSQPRCLQCNDRRFLDRLTAVTEPVNRLQSSDLPPMKTNTKNDELRLKACKQYNVGRILDD